MSGSRQAKSGALVLDADLEGEMVLSIEDPRVPSAVRAHGARYSHPARWVVETEPGGYVLSAANGELLDFCALQ